MNIQRIWEKTVYACGAVYGWGYVLYYKSKRRRASKDAVRRAARRGAKNAMKRQMAVDDKNQNE